MSERLHCPRSSGRERRRSPRDLAMYAVLRHALQQRVRMLERAINATVWGCGSKG